MRDDLGVEEIGEFCRQSDCSCLGTSYGSAGRAEWFHSKSPILCKLHLREWLQAAVQRRVRTR